MKALDDYGVDEYGEALDLVPQRYTDGSLALVAMLDSGECYANISVNLSAYGLRPGRNTVFVPDDVSGVLGSVDGRFGDSVEYGYGCRATEFAFGEDAEALADANIATRTHE